MLFNPNWIVLKIIFLQATTLNGLWTEQAVYAIYTCTEVCIYHLCVYILIENNNYRRNNKIYSRRDHKFKGGTGHRNRGKQENEGYRLCKYSILIRKPLKF